jgi:hypothetical protein
MASAPAISCGVVQSFRMTNTRHGHGGGLTSTISYKCSVVKRFGQICRRELSRDSLSSAPSTAYAVTRAPYRRAALGPSPDSAWSGRTRSGPIRGRSWGGPTCGPDCGGPNCGGGSASRGPGPGRPGTCGPASGSTFCSNNPGVVTPGAMRQPPGRPLRWYLPGLRAAFVHLVRRSGSRGSRRQGVPFRRARGCPRSRLATGPPSASGRLAGTGRFRIRRAPVRFPLGTVRRLRVLRCLEASLVAGSRSRRCSRPGHHPRGSTQAIRSHNRGFHPYRARPHRRERSSTCPPIPAALDGSLLGDMAGRHRSRARLDRVGAESDSWPEDPRAGFLTP